MMTDSVHCSACGYELTGVGSNRCPECGGLDTVTTATTLAASRRSHQIRWIVALLAIGHPLAVIAAVASRDAAGLVAILSPYAILIAWSLNSVAGIGTALSSALLMIE